MIRIDAHQHFWKYNPSRDAWINDDMQVIQRDFMPEDLSPILKASNIDGCIAVQADQSEEETNFLLGLSEENDFILGVVGWVDLRAQDLESRLEHYSHYPKLKGWRHVVQGEPDVNFMLRDDFLMGISLLSQYNHTYDILIYPKQLSAALEMVQLFPNQKFIIDHIAKPHIQRGEIAEWVGIMSQLGALDNVWCKVSGMVTEADWVKWQQSDIDPYLQVVFDFFGIEKVIFGSDWPVCLLAAPYERIVEIPSAFMEAHDIANKAKFWGDNSIEFYNLDIQHLE